MNQFYLPALLIVLIGLMAAVPANSQTFDFDTGTPTLSPGMGTPLQQTKGGVTATFSSPSDGLYGTPAYSVQSDATTQFKMSQFSGNYLYPDTVYKASLDIRFSAQLSSISFTFATADFQQVEVPSPIKVTAYQNSTANPPIGSATAQGTYGGDTMPMGTISLTTSQPFNVVEILLPYYPNGASDFLVDNIIVTVASPVTAAAALGQIDLTHNAAGGGQAGMTGPSGTAIDTHSTPNHIFVADPGNNRVLGWNDAINFNSGQLADLVLGQADFASSAAGSGAGGMASPAGVGVDPSHNVIIADTGNNRVTIFADPFAWKQQHGQSAGEPASAAFGQPDLNAVTCNQGGTPGFNTLCAPRGVWSDAAGNVFIADSTNNRVLAYLGPIPPNAVQGSAPGAAGDLSADLVFGQKNFSTAACNQGGASMSPTTLCAPGGGAADSQRHVYIADTSNNRVLEYDNPLAGSSDPAAGVIIADHNAACPSPGTGTLCAPMGAAVIPGDNLLVADQGFSRVLEYTQPYLSHLKPPLANMVFGQGSLGNEFTTSTCFNSPVTANGMCTPFSVTVDSACNFYASDTGNNRVLRYDQPLGPCPASPTPTATATSTPTATPTATATSTATPTATPTAMPGQLAASPGRRNFGSMVFGGISGATSTGKVVTIINKSRTASAPISASATGDFKIISGAGASARGFAACASTLHSNGKCAITLTFTPTGFGTRLGSLIVDGTAIAQLSGVGTHGRITIAPKALNFGKIPLGTQPKKTVLLTNRSTVGMLISGIEVSPSGDFSATQNCVKTLDPGVSGACQVSVTFDPSATGAKNATLTIAHAGAGSPQRIALKGIAR